MVSRGAWSLWVDLTIDFHVSRRIVFPGCFWVTSRLLWIHLVLSALVKLLIWRIGHRIWFLTKEKNFFYKSSFHWQSVPSLKRGGFFSLIFSLYNSFLDDIGLYWIEEIVNLLQFLRRFMNSSVPIHMSKMIFDFLVHVDLDKFRMIVSLSFKFSGDLLYWSLNWVTSEKLFHFLVAYHSVSRSKFTFRITWSLETVNYISEDLQRP